MGQFSMTKSRYAGSLLSANQQVVKRLNGRFLIRVEDTSIPVEVDADTAEIGRILLETSARQVDAKIEKRLDGHRTTVDVTLLIDA